MGDAHHCWVVVSEMTYTVLSGTLNSSIPYLWVGENRCSSCRTRFAGFVVNSLRVHSTSRRKCWWDASQPDDCSAPDDWLLDAQSRVVDI